MEIRADIQDAEVKRLLVTVAERYGNLRPVFRDIGEIETRRVDDRFVNEVDPDGNPWAPLSAATMMMGLGRQKGGFKKSGYLGKAGKRYLQNKKILQESGALRGDIHYQYDDSHVEWGTSGRIPYAGIHQFGGQAGRNRKVTISARPYLGRNVSGGMEIAPGDRQAALEAVMAYLTP